MPLNQETYSNAFKTCSVCFNLFPSFIIPFMFSSLTDKPTRNRG